MEIQNASTTPSKSNQMRNVNTADGSLRRSPLNQGTIGSEVIAFVINADLIVTANNFCIFRGSKSRKEVSLSEVFALFN